MTRYQLGTIFFCVALIACVAIFDVLIFKFGGGRATISTLVLRTAYSPPWGALLVLAIGILLGHLLWPQRSP